MEGDTAANGLRVQPTWPTPECLGRLEKLKLAKHHTCFKCFEVLPTTCWLEGIDLEKPETRTRPQAPTSALAVPQLIAFRLSTADGELLATLLQLPLPQHDSFRQRLEIIVGVYIQHALQQIGFTDRKSMRRARLDVAKVARRLAAALNKLSHENQLRLCDALDAVERRTIVGRYVPDNVLWLERLELALGDRMLPPTVRKPVADLLELKKWDKSSSDYFSLWLSTDQLSDLPLQIDPVSRLSHQLAALAEAADTAASAIADQKGPDYDLAQSVFIYELDDLLVELTDRHLTYYQSADGSPDPYAPHHMFAEHLLMLARGHVPFCIRKRHPKLMARQLSWLMRRLRLQLAKGPLRIADRPIRE